MKLLRIGPAGQGETLHLGIEGLGEQTQVVRIP